MPFSVSHSLKSKKRNLHGRRRTHTLGRRNDSRHLLVESLEDRRLLAVITWSGGAGPSNTNWMTAENWVGGVAPSAGDDLVFPSGPVNTSTSNNFPVNTGFGSIDITGPDYTLEGNTVTLQGNGTIGAISPVQVLGTLLMSGTLSTPLVDFNYGSVDPAGPAATASLNTGSLQFNGAHSRCN